MLKPQPVTSTPRTASDSQPIAASNPKPAARKQPLNPWHAQLSPYRAPSVVRSLWQVGNTLVLLVLSWGLTFELVSRGNWLAVLPMFISSLLLVRVFVLQHDCGHRSFMPTAKGCDRIGVWLGILTLTPYHTWRRLHALHHATSGDLDRRGKGGEIHVLTVKEYRELSNWGRLLYRLYRNPFVLLVIGPFYQFAIRQRFAFELPREWKRERYSVYFTNLGVLVFCGALIWAYGWTTFLLAYVPVFTLAASAGVWLFYVQHQYEEGITSTTTNGTTRKRPLKGARISRCPACCSGLPPTLASITSITWIARSRTTTCNSAWMNNLA
ncbi:MAG: fatty acid desaturase [Pirellulaceae bacterium]